MPLHALNARNRGVSSHRRSWLHKKSPHSRGYERKPGMDVGILWVIVHPCSYVMLSLADHRSKPLITVVRFTFHQCAVIVALTKTSSVTSMNTWRKWESSTAQWGQSAICVGGLARIAMSGDENCSRKWGSPTPKAWSFFPWLYMESESGFLLGDTTVLIQSL